MDSRLLRTYKFIHTWTGITTALILFVAFYAGSLTVFKEPLNDWLEPVRPVPQTSFKNAAELIDKTVAAYPDARKDLILKLDEDTVSLSWKKGRDDPATTHAGLTSGGTLKVQTDEAPDVPQFIDVIHQTAGIPGTAEFGRYITGVASGLYFLALVSGLIIVLPTLMRDLFALRIGRGLKRMWMDAHNALGIASLPFHIVIALTAMVFGLHDEIYGAQDLLIYNGSFKSIIRENNPFAPGKPNEEPAKMLEPHLILGKVHDLSPEFKPELLRYRNANTQSASVMVIGSDDRFMVREHGLLFMNAITGQVTNTEYFPGHQGLWAAISSTIFALHFASFGGETIRWTYLLMGLSGAFLFYSGNLLWLESRRKRDAEAGSAKSQRRSVRVMAALTVGTAIGCMAGLSCVLLIGRWFQAFGLSPWNWTYFAYYVPFTAALAFSVYRGAATGAVVLMQMTALVTLAIPLTSLLLLLSGKAVSTNITIDLVALSGAMAFAFIARKTRQRASGKDRDSIWSALPYREPLAGAAE